jgi:hypothetical protein
MSKCDKWLGIFLFFLLTNNSKQLLSLINGEDFDLEFNKLVDDINEVDSDVFKNECLEGLLKNKQMLEDLNKAYKSGGFKHDS